MATRFALEIDCPDSSYADSLFREVFQLIDELELTLSRFVPDSDVSRINNLKEGENVMIENESWEVLKRSIQVMAWTGGAFDVGIGKHMDIFRAAKQGLRNDREVINAQKMVHEEKQKASIYVDPDEPRVYTVKEGMHVDLGTPGASLPVRGGQGRDLCIPISSSLQTYISPPRL